MMDAIEGFQWICEIETGAKWFAQYREMFLRDLAFSTADPDKAKEHLRAAMENLTDMRKACEKLLTLVEGK